MTLKEFFAPNKWGTFPFAVYVNHPNFSDLYVRRSPLYLSGQKIDKAVTIANVTAHTTGKGSFSRLILELFADTDCDCVYVENVLSESLKPKLEHLGFKQAPDKLPPCYILWRRDYDPISTSISRHKILKECADIE